MLNAILAVCILILDQSLKYWTILNLVPGEGSKTLIPGVVELVNVHNTGAAFGFLADGRWFFVGLTIVVAIVVIVVLSRDIISGKLARFSLIAILAGGIGNCIDRIINGYVVDMFNLQFMDFAVFNVADIFVTVFGVIFCICLLTGKAVDKEEASAVFRINRPEEKNKVDYITQLKKPVVEGREAIETEKAAHSAPNSTIVHKAEDDFGAWNMPEAVADHDVSKPVPMADPFAEFSKQRPTAPEPFSQTARRPAPPPLGEAPAPRTSPAPAAPSTKTTSFDDPFNEQSKSPKKDNDFNLEDIIAEFKD